MNPVRAFLAPFLPYIIGGGLIALGLAGWWAYNTVWERGYDKATQEGIEAAAAATKAMQGALDEAEARDTVERVKIVTRFKPLKERAANAPNDPACPDPATRRLLDEAVRAANDTAPAAKGE